jgi:hypothetical protein
VRRLASLHRNGIPDGWSATQQCLVELHRRVGRLPLLRAIDLNKCYAQFSTFDCASSGLIGLPLEQDAGKRLSNLEWISLPASCLPGSGPGICHTRFLVHPCNPRQLGVSRLSGRGPVDSLLGFRGGSPDRTRKWRVPFEYRGHRGDYRQTLNSDLTASFR